MSDTHNAASQITAMMLFCTLKLTKVIDWN